MRRRMMKKIPKWRMLSTILLLSTPFCVLSFPIITVSPTRRIRTTPLSAGGATDDSSSACIDTFNGKLSSVIAKGNVKIGKSETHGWGLMATKDIQKGESCVQIPFGCEITATTAKAVFQNYLPKEYDSWTGETGLMALQLLNEVASRDGMGGIALPQRNAERTEFMEAWLTMITWNHLQKHETHPLLWNEDDQEVLQSSTTNKIYRRLDDLEEDYQWLEEHVFAKDRSLFPSMAKNEQPCFSLEGFKWAMSIVQSRSFFLDGMLRLIPVIDFCNHKDTAEELTTTSTGLFGGSKGANVLAAEDIAAGSEIYVSYGPQSAAEYLLQYGFVPELCWKTPIVELSVEMDPEDRFYDDKLDILEYETYELAPMDPEQTFDVAGNDGSLDPALIQFVRLRELAKYDAFLLESIFRKEVWGFMASPVSETNELAVLEHLLAKSRAFLDEFQECVSTRGPGVCTKLRQSETAVLERMMTVLEQEKEGLDLKEYYQERRLKDLGLDSVWTPEDDILEADLSYGQTRAPGGADYDW